MEHSNSQVIKRKEALEKYHNMTSPLVPLHVAQQQEQAKQEIRLNASLRLDCIKNRSAKLSTLENQSFS